MDSMLAQISKLFEKFNDEVRRTSNLHNTSDDCIDEATSNSMQQEYRRRLQNLKAMFEVELQNKFMKAQKSNSNAVKFEKDLQRQLAMKLTREEKLSLAIYQERYIQEFIKENIETLKHSSNGQEYVG